MNYALTFVGLPILNCICISNKYIMHFFNLKLLHLLCITTFPSGLILKSGSCSGRRLSALFMGIADQTIWAVAERPVNFHLAKRLNTTNVSEKNARVLANFFFHIAKLVEVTVIVDKTFCIIDFIHGQSDQPMLRLWPFEWRNRLLWPGGWWSPPVGFGRWVPGLTHPDVQDVVVAHRIALIIILAGGGLVVVVITLAVVVQAGGGCREDPGVSKCISTYDCFFRRQE